MKRFEVGGSGGENDALAQLRQMTQVHHEALEGAMRLDSPQMDHAAYTTLVRRLHALYRVLETGTEHAPGIERWHTELSHVGLQWSERRKLGWLAADLQALGISALKPSEVPAQNPPLDTFAQCLGCLYVLEGSTLGGQVITRRLRTHLGLTPDTGLRFFSGYAGKTGAMWRQMRTALNWSLIGQPAIDLAVGAAQQTFVTFQSWLAP